MHIPLFITIHIVSLVALVFIVNATTPTSIGPFGILIVFLLMYASTLSLLALILLVFTKLLARTLFKDKKQALLGPKKLLMLASFMAFAPIALIASQSIGRLSMYDVALVALFETIAIIYVIKR